MIHCFYHSADLDGHCSGAIVKYRYPEAVMHPINYGDEFLWDSIHPDEQVFMVDFTLQPFDQMERLNKLCRLTWIDHHKTEVEEAYKRGFIANDGQRIEVGVAACELTFEHVVGLKRNTIPLAVKLLGRYDVWDHSDERTLPFQYGFRMFPDTRPENQDLWKPLLDGGHQSGFDIAEVIKYGNLILSYEDQQNSKFCKAYAFETVLKIPCQTPVCDQFQDTCDGHEKYFAICANRGFTNSKLFDSIYDPENHDLMITFCRLKPPSHKWTVSLYSTKSNVDCGSIARIFGGGGHKGAAGFQCETLPFKI